jgi:16S rRNA (guanine966-N2)-methyltransferase
MTRIISGKYKGRSIGVPPTVTRPTSSRVREAVFSSVLHTLGSFDGLAVLDLFAGSGALGLEALSRGAAKAHFVESDRNAIGCIEENAKSLGELNISVQKADVLALVDSVASQSRADLVFIDPPYVFSDEQIIALLAALAKNQWLAVDAVVVVERSSKSEIIWPLSYSALANKTYGDTAIWYGVYTPAKVEV